MKRIVLFLITNLAIVLVLSVVARLLGIDNYMSAQGQSLGGLLVFCALFGFGGAFIGPLCLGLLASLLLLAAGSSSME